jgi:hypothetical protein
VKGSSGDVRSGKLVSLSGREVVIRQNGTDQVGLDRNPISGDGTAQLSLSEQAPDSLTGTWSATFKNGDSFSGLAVAGLFAPIGYGVMLYVDPPPPCASPGGPLPGFTLINVPITSSRLTAVAGRTSCNGTSFGTLTLAKQ